MNTAIRANAMVVGLAVLAVGNLQGCSTRAWYEGMKMGHDNRCSLAPVSEYDACVGEHTDAYDVYQEKRDQVVGEEVANAE